MSIALCNQIRNLTQEPIQYWIILVIDSLQTGTILSCLSFRLSTRRHKFEIEGICNPTSLCEILGRIAPLHQKYNCSNLGSIYIYIYTLQPYPQRSFCKRTWLPYPWSSIRIRQNCSGKARRTSFFFTTIMPCALFSRKPDADWWVLHGRKQKIWSWATSCWWQGTTSHQWDRRAIRWYSRVK